MIPIPFRASEVAKAQQDAIVARYNIHSIIIILRYVQSNQRTQVCNRVWNGTNQCIVTQHPSNSIIQYILFNFFYKDNNTTYRVVTGPVAVWQYTPYQGTLHA